MNVTAWCSFKATKNMFANAIEAIMKKPTITTVKVSTLCWLIKTC